LNRDSAQDRISPLTTMKIEASVGKQGAAQAIDNCRRNDCRIVWIGASHRNCLAVEVYVSIAGPRVGAGRDDDRTARADAA